jgi:N6-adenosine-specific RNA methylase IME4
VLADPPWSFKTWSGKTGTPHRTANDHYITTETTALCDIPVTSVCLPDCALFMWVVDSHIDAAIELGKAWGFTLKTRAFTWRKLAANGNARIGMGYWTRKQTEMCLLFTRGKVRRKDKGVREIIDAPRREHSRKPDEQYNRIERLVDGPYLELFARQAWTGWDAWGNQVGKYEADRPVAAQAQLFAATPANDNSPVGDLFAQAGAA